MKGEPKLKGKIAIVTGASTGIGREIAKAIAIHGGRIKITNLWDILVGSIAPEQTVEIEIGLFSSIINATGSLHISFESENEETHMLSIPLESKEIGT